MENETQEIYDFIMVRTKIDHLTEMSQLLNDIIERKKKIDSISSI